MKPIHGQLSTETSDRFIFGIGEASQPEMHIISQIIAARIIPQHLQH